jgi:hypothetical protein
MRRLILVPTVALLGLTLVSAGGVEPCGEFLLAVRDCGGFGVSSQPGEDLGLRGQ